MKGVLMARHQSDMRVFDTGAFRDQDKNKIDIEGHISPAALQVYLEYMHKHRFLEDGSMRDSDNWQKGIPIGQYVKSLLRHALDVWLWNRGFSIKEPIKDALCGVMFNTIGILHEFINERHQNIADVSTKPLEPRTGDLLLFK
jgi:hypothetical protein